MNPFKQKSGYSYINTDSNEVEFILWSPEQEKVNVKITHPEISEHPMQKDEWGYWKARVPNIKEGTRYVFKLEDGSERADPASVSQPEGVHLPSEIINKTFTWTDDAWKGLALSDLIIYELHTGTFTPEGTFDGITSKLDYLKELGINAIELMPVAQFSGNRNWGYDGVYPYAIQHSYGSAASLKNLVNEAHHRGIAVILDVVYNHVGPEGCYLKDFAPYFTDKYNTPWGDAINYDAAYCDGVRNYFIQNALMWLDEFHMDGLRMDAVHAIMDHSALHVMKELKQEVVQLAKSSGKEKFLIAELDLNDARYINPSELGGYGLDGQWIDEFHHALHSVLTGETDGYYEDFGTLQHLEQAYRNTYVYNGVYSTHRKKMFGSQPETNPYSQFVVFSQNHDHIGNRALGDRLSSTLSFEALKLSAAAVLISPYVPLLFMGEEYGEKNPFLYFVNHQDSELGKMVSEGRKKEFEYFNFKDEFPDPLTEEVFQQSKLSWKYNEHTEASMLSFYKHLIAFRKQHPVMQSKSRSSMIVHPVGNGNILALERFNNNDSLLFVMNFGKEPESYTNTTLFSYKKIFDSSDIEWSGPQVAAFNEYTVHESIEIHPTSISIFQSIR